MEDSKKSVVEITVRFQGGARATSAFLNVLKNGIESAGCADEESNKEMLERMFPAVPPLLAKGAPSTGPGKVCYRRTVWVLLSNSKTPLEFKEGLRGLYHYITGKMVRIGGNAFNIRDYRGGLGKLKEAVQALLDKHKRGVKCLAITRRTNDGRLVTA